VLVDIDEGNNEGVYDDVRGCVLDMEKIVTLNCRTPYNLLQPGRISSSRTMAVSYGTIPIL
jgi:hypothetical protein